MKPTDQIAAEARNKIKQYLLRDAGIMDEEIDAIIQSAIEEATEGKDKIIATLHETCREYDVRLGAHDDREHGNGYYEARPESEYNGTPIPASVVFIYHDEKGRRCTQFVATCESANRDRNQDSKLIASLLNQSRSHGNKATWE